jgi:pyrroline-5-carboxylate reductase
VFLNDKTLAVLGAGRLGESLIAGLIEAEAIAPDRIIATAKHRERLDTVQGKYKVRTTIDNREAVRAAQIVILAVKPQVVREVLVDVKKELTPEHLLISVAASVTTPFMERELDGPVPVVRAMPNTPCLVKTGMTAVCGGKHATHDHLQLTRKIFQQVGRCLILEERYFDAVTGLSASGPAFIYIMIESLAEAGVKVGLPRAVATELAAQTVLGSAKMVLETGEHPAQLKDQVTTPAGCTIDGILELEEGGLRVTLIKAVVRATRRASELVSG